VKARSAPLSVGQYVITGMTGPQGHSVMQMAVVDQQAQHPGRMTAGNHLEAVDLVPRQKDSGGTARRQTHGVACRQAVLPAARPQQLHCRLLPYSRLEKSGQLLLLLVPVVLVVESIGGFLRVNQ